jgi:outer membrane lipopolysaccharide assembly protein LptE/RlpB
MQMQSSLLHKIWVNSKPVAITCWLMLLLSISLAGVGLTGCSGKPFHLRGSVALKDDYKRVYLQGEPVDGDFGKVLQRAFEEAGSELVSSPAEATAILQLNNYEEGKRVAGYGKNREVREYLIFLRFNFETKSVTNLRNLLPMSEINLDKLQIYDSAFVLGKIEEERLIKKDLRKSAARQVITRLKYGSKE